MTSISSVPAAPRRPSETARKIYYRLKAIEQLHLFYSIIPVMVSGLVLLPSTFLLRSSLANVMIRSQWGYTKAPGYIMAKQKSRNNTVQGKPYTLYAYKFQYKYNHQSFRGVQFLWEPDSKPAFKVSQKIQVEFSRYLPRFSRIAGLKQMKGNTDTILYIVMFVILSLLAMGVYWIMRGIGPRRKRRKTYETGLPAPAKLTLVDNSPDMRVAGQQPIRLNWTYSIDGQDYEDSYSSMRMSEIQEITKLGEDIYVLYHPDDPHFSLPYIPEKAEEGRRQ